MNVCPLCPPSDICFWCSLLSWPTYSFLIEGLPTVFWGVSSLWKLYNHSSFVNLLPVGSYLSPWSMNLEMGRRTPASSPKRGWHLAFWPGLVPRPAAWINAEWQSFWLASVAGKVSDIRPVGFGDVYKEIRPSVRGSMEAEFSNKRMRMLEPGITG